MKEISSEKPVKRGHGRGPENKFDVAHDRAEFHAVGSSVIEGIINRPEERALFDMHYPNANTLDKKYRLARDLILDGRFTDPVYLMVNFTPRRLEIPDEFQETAKYFKERLHFLLIQKGHLEPSSMSKDTSERLLSAELKSRQNFQDLLAEGWPIEVVGQLMTVDLFTDITDAKKMEEYRAWTTRGIIRDYLGVISGKRIDRNMLSISDLFDRIPKRVFSNPDSLKFHLVEHYLEERLSRTITDEGLEPGLTTIENLIETCQDGDKRQFLQRLYDRFTDIATYNYGTKFKNTILLKGREKAFPSFEQMTFAYDFINHGTRLLTADTGLGKTGAAYLGIENTNARKVLIIAPATGKATWAIEDEKLFKNSGNVFIIDGGADIEAAISSGKKYIVISQELLGRAENQSNFLSQLEDFVDRVDIDGAIIDEIDNLKNPQAISTKTAIALVEKIRKNHAEAPIIGLSATPLRNKLSDLNVTMGILYPESYAISHKTQTPEQKSFSDTHLQRPDLVYFTLIGEKRMYRWEKATGVQEFSYERLPVEVSPFEDYLYTFIANEVATDGLNKIRILEDSLFNPLLVKAEVRSLAKDKIPEFDIDTAMTKLTGIIADWKIFRKIESPEKEEDYLSADRLVELGHGDFVLACFFSDLLESGVDTLVEELTHETDDPTLSELRKFWKKLEMSTKYKLLKEIIEEALTWKENPDGTVSREKVFIVSPSRRQGRTGDVIQRTIKIDGENERNLYAQYELDSINDSTLAPNVASWIKPYCQDEDVILIDGSTGVGRRKDNLIETWVNDPASAVLIATLEATYQSRDFTLNVIENERGKIDEVKKIFLAPPWHYQQLKQMGGRSQRQGQLIPVDVKVMESKNVIDYGKAEAVLYSYLLSRMALSGIVLTPDEQAFFDSKRLGRKIPFRSYESIFLSSSLDYLRGAGEDKIADFLIQQTTFGPEQSHAEAFANEFFADGRDEYHITGYNAELVAGLIKHLGIADKTILSLGAGTLLLQRKLKKGIDNVDINPYMMEAGWKSAEKYGGRKIAARASSLSPDEFRDESYDLVDSSYCLNWSKLGLDIVGSERVKILREINRVLKKQGLFILTLPENSFNESTFNSFIKALNENFGFIVDRELSGQSYAISTTLDKRLGWAIVARKTGEPNLANLSLNDLRFSNEDDRWISLNGKSNKNQTKIAATEYPSAMLKLEFDRYVIYNGSDETTIIGHENPIYAKVLPEVEVDKEKFMSLEFLRGETQEDYKNYRNKLLRPAIRITGKSWSEIEDIESLCNEAFMAVQNRRGPIKSQVVAYSHILKEIEKNARRNKLNNIE